MEHGPARLGTVVFSLLLAMMLTILPMPDALLVWRPNWVAITIIYWTLVAPTRVGVGTAWFCGILLDVLKAAVLGQHALALTVVATMALRLHQRIRVFPVWQQTVSIALILTVYEFLLFWIDGIMGDAPLTLLRWGPVLTSALVWPLFAFALGQWRRA